MSPPQPGIAFADARAPDGMRLYAIGDVHGCLDQLAAMHRLIAAEIARDRPADWRIVHLGDYVDRGPDSSGVLSFLAEAKARDRRHVTLCGNHDAGLLEFLAGPAADSLFLRFGGVDTAASYGVGLDFADLERTREKLAAAIPGSHIELLASLERSASFGDFFFCHAGIMPGVALDAQRPETLIWIRDAFLDCRDLHPLVVVHGHTPCARPEVRTNRVNVDTGCFHSGVLTALVVDGAEKRFLTVGS